MSTTEKSKTVSVEKIIRDTAATLLSHVRMQLRIKVEEQKRGLWTTASIIDRDILTHRDKTPALIRAANVILRRYNQPIVESLNGYDVLALNEVLESERVCRRCTDPLECPFRGWKTIPVVYEAKKEKIIVSEAVWCEKYRRAQKMQMIERLSDGKFNAATLEEKSTAELDWMIQKLRSQNASSRKRG